MRVYFQNYREKTGVPTGKPLYGSIWQVLDIFDNLPEEDGSFIGIVDDDDESLQFMKYNKYVWLIEIPKPDLGGSYQGYFTKNKCRKIILEIFDGLPLSQVAGLSFEKYL
ncbi:MAG: hypothetical protein Q4G27_01655 [Flavobacteriaceae bacterium]|nr:hypothetical protein [Flavobacteriaceae bacterium]